jgi:hypothetical protein
MADAAQSPMTRFQAGNAVAEDAFYVEREADRELVRALDGGELCYVFATTQTGKSSLKLRAMRTLEERGFVTVDITLAGGVTEEQWYYGLAKRLARELGLGIDVGELWDRDAKLAHVQRWTAFLHEELLPRVTGRLAIFLDEVNVAATVEFEIASFFASIRDLYDAGRRHAVTFCLLGITFPEALMKDAARSPFRTGRAVVVGDFTRGEMEALAPGLAGAGCAAEEVLDEVYAWTHGHPYMTQRVCALVAEGGEGAAKERVRGAVEEAFLDVGRPRDPNLRFAETYLGRKGVPAGDLVFLLRRVLEGEVIAFDPNSLIEQHACLSGLLAARTGDDGKQRLVVRNKVFAEVLGLAWVKEREGEQVFGDQLGRWLGATLEEKGVYLLRGRELEDALARVKERGELGAQEETFLRESQEGATREREREALLEKERRERAEERARVARRNARVLAVLVGVLMVALGVAVWQFLVARTATEEADRRTRIETGLRASALAEQPGREMEALRLGIHALADQRADLTKAPPAVVQGMIHGFMNSHQLATLEGHTGEVRAASFSPDGTRVVTGSDDKTARLWDATNGKPLATLQGHTSSVSAVAFSPDGTRAVTSSSDNTARLWDAKDGELLAVLSGHHGPVTSVAFSPDGRHVATASEDGTARIWAATPEGFLIQACQYLAPWPSFADVKETCTPYLTREP